MLLPAPELGTKLYQSLPMEEYPNITSYMVSVHTFLNYINDQRDPGFHLKSYMMFFGEPECIYQDQGIPVVLLPVGIEDV